MRSLPNYLIVIACTLAFLNHSVSFGSTIEYIGGEIHINTNNTPINQIIKLLNDKSPVRIDIKNYNFKELVSIDKSFDSTEAALNFILKNYQTIILYSKENQLINVTVFNKCSTPNSKENNYVKPRSFEIPFTDYSTGQSTAVPNTIDQPIGINSHQDPAAIVLEAHSIEDPAAVDLASNYTEDPVALALEMLYEDDPLVTELDSTASEEQTAELEHINLPSNSPNTLIVEESYKEDSAALEYK